MGSCLRKDTLFKTKTDKINTLFKTKIPKNIPWLAARPHEALITEYPPPPGVRSICLLGVQVAVEGEGLMVLAIDNYDYSIF